MNKILGFILSIVCLLQIQQLTAQPAWTVNSSNFQYSMSAIGVIKINSVESTDSTDLVAAFVNGECRGVTHPQLINALKRYFAFLLIYSNTSTGETVSYKVWKASNNTTFNITYTNIFNSLSSIGTSSNPVVWAFPALNTGTDINTFSFAQQTGNSVINSANHTISVFVPQTVALTNLVATFTLSTNANAFIGTTPEMSGTTANDFTNPIVYKVVAEDGTTTKNWTISVSLSSVVPINEPSANIFDIFPNPTSGIVHINSQQNISIYNQCGKIVFEKSIDQNFTGILDLHFLPKGIYFIKCVGSEFLNSQKLIIQ